MQRLVRAPVTCCARAPVSHSSCPSLSSFFLKSCGLGLSSCGVGHGRHIAAFKSPIKVEDKPAEEAEANPDFAPIVSTDSLSLSWVSLSFRRTGTVNAEADLALPARSTHTHTHTYLRLFAVVGSLPHRAGTRRTRPDAKTGLPPASPVCSGVLSAPGSHSILLLGALRALLDISVRHAG